MRYKSEDDFSKAVKSGTGGGLYLLYGGEEYLVDTWKNKLAKPFSDAGAFNLHKLDGRNLDCDALYDAIESLPLMAPQKCVIADDIDVSKADMRKLMDALSDPPDDCVLIITGKSAFDPKSANAKKLIKLAEDNGHVIELGARGQQGLVSFLKSVAKKNGAVLSTALASEIVESCGSDMNRLRREMEKICAYAGYSEIGPEHVRAVATVRTEAKVFDLGKAILSGNTGRAMGILDDLFELREQPVAILSTLIMSYVDLYKARIARDHGIQQNQAVDELGYKGREFRMRNAFAQKISTAAVRRAVEALYDCDRRMKSTGINDRVLLEQTVVRLFMAEAG